MFVLICRMLSDLEVKCSVYFVPELHTLTFRGHRRKTPVSRQSTALVVAVMFLFSVWKVPLGEYYKA